MKNREISRMLGCRPFNVPSYIELLKTVTIKNKSLRVISRDLDWSETTVYDKIRLMEDRGFVESIKDGHSRIVGLTDKGQGFLKEVGGL